MSYVIKEAASGSQRLRLTGLQLLLEVLTVKVVEFLQITENSPSLTTQILWDIWSGQQGIIMSQDVSQRANVLHLRQQELLHDPLKLPVEEIQVLTYF